MILFILCFLSSIISIPLSINAHESGIEVAEKIANLTIITVAKNNHISVDDPAFLEISKRFRKACLETIPICHEKILQNPSQLRPLIDECRSTLSLKFSQISLNKRFIFTAWYLIKQTFIMMAVGLLISYVVGRPRQMIRDWYCENHPCEPDDDQ